MSTMTQIQNVAVIEQSTTTEKPVPTFADGFKKAMEALKSIKSVFELATTPEKTTVIGINLDRVACKKIEDTWYIVQLVGKDGYMAVSKGKSRRDAWKAFQRKQYNAL